MRVSDLGLMLSTSDAAKRRKAAELLSQYVASAPEVAADLVKHTGDDDRIVAEYCVAALEELGPPAESQLHALAVLATSPNADVAYWAVTLLGRAGEAAARHAAVLADVVASEAAPQVRQRAAWALEAIWR